MRLFQALIVAEAVMGVLRPSCDRIEVAGSVRRKKEEPHDLEICCIVKQSEILDFIQAANGLGEVIRGDAGGKYLQTKLPQGINLDLFILRPENWGWLFLVRTGSAEFSHAMACRLNDNGFTSVDGMVTVRRTGKALPMREEEDVFKLIGIPYIPPENRI